MVLRRAATWLALPSLSAWRDAATQNCFELAAWFDC